MKPNGWVCQPKSLTLLCRHTSIGLTSSLLLVIFLSELESKVGKPLLRFATKRFGFGLNPPTLGDGTRVFLCVKRPSEGPERGPIHGVDSFRLREAVRYAQGQQQRRD